MKAGEEVGVVFVDIAERHKRAETKIFVDNV